MGICLQSEVTYPEGVDLEVGHNPVQTNGPTNLPSGLPVFEILNRLTQTQYNTLGLSCPLANPAPVQVGFKLGEALPTLASSALKMAGMFVGKFAEKLLPARAFAVGGLDQWRRRTDLVLQPIRRGGAGQPDPVRRDGLPLPGGE